VKMIIILLFLMMFLVSRQKKEFGYYAKLTRAALALELFLFLLKLRAIAVISKVFAYLKELT